jgi:hypothetical protein
MKEDSQRDLLIEISHTVKKIVDGIEREIEILPPMEALGAETAEIWARKRIDSYDPEAYYQGWSRDPEEREDL